MRPLEPANLTGSSAQERPTRDMAAASRYPCWRPPPHTGVATALRLLACLLPLGMLPALQAAPSSAAVAHTASQGSKRTTRPNPSAASSAALAHTATQGLKRTTRPNPSAASSAALAHTATVPDPTTWGPFGVGVTTIDVADPSRGRRMLVDIWYPAFVEPDAPGEYYYHLLWGAATRDALLDDTLGPYPLIAFSHGSGGMRDQSVFYTEQLASHGYIVIAPDHPGNTLLDSSATSMGQSVIDRPLDISLVIDVALEMSAAGTFPIGGAVDEAHIGVTGHSFGAYTTLVICGAWLSLEAARADCEATGDKMMCEAVNYAESLYGEGLEWLDLSDPRVEACVPMAPGIYDYFGDEGLSHAFAPMAVMASANDSVLPYEEEAVPIFAALPSPKGMMTLLHRDHYPYSSLWDIRPAAGSCSGYEACGDRDPSHELVNTLGTAFFGTYLKDMGEDYDPYLEATFYTQTWPGRVTFESAW